MASQPVTASQPTIEIPGDLRELLQLHETGTDYCVTTLSGATLIRPKAEIRYAWQLLEGILDDGKDTTEERQLEREREFAHDARMLGL
jgi:hypothetical protein